MASSSVKNINFKLINRASRFFPFILIILTLFLFTRVNDVVKNVMAEEKMEAPAPLKNAKDGTQKQANANTTANTTEKIATTEKPGAETTKASSENEIAPTSDQVAAAIKDEQKKGNKLGMPKGFTLGLGDEDIDILQLTPQHVKVLESLASRREALEKRATEIEKKKAFLSALEKRIEEKTSELKSIKSNLETITKEIADKESKAVEHLSLVYKNMKPKIAAEKLNPLDQEVIILIFRKMNPRTIASILSFMDQEKAKAITTRLANESEPTGYGKMMEKEGRKG